MLTLREGYFKKFLELVLIFSDYSTKERDFIAINTDNDMAYFTKCHKSPHSTPDDLLSNRQ